MEMLSHNNQHEQIEACFSKFFSEFKVGTLLKKAGVSKIKGYSALTIFNILMTLAFTKSSLSKMMKDNNETQSNFPKKDTFYRFLNNGRFNWRSFLLSLAAGVIHYFTSIGDTINDVPVLIADDTLYRRNCSKKVDLLGYGQGRSYNMMIAHTTIVMARYMMLGIEQRRATDPRSLGNLFEDYCDNMISAKFGKALRLLLTQLASAVQTIAAELGAFFENLITQFIGQLPRIPTGLSAILDLRNSSHLYFL